MNPRSPKYGSLGARATCFLAVFAFLQLSWDSLRGGSLERLIVHDGTVRPAAFLVNWLTPTVAAQAVDFSIRAPGGGLNILNGCEGTETLFVLIAALIVAPIPWSARLWGLLCGSLFVFAINQLRILTLFYTYRTDPAWFAPLHGTVTPIAMILLVCGFFYAWLNYSGRRTTAAI